MEGYFSLAVVIIGFIIALVVVRKDTADNNGFSKKGVIKLATVLALVFIAIVIEVFITPESWM
jgi:ABC-type Co2+ transport system permease subunit